MIEGIVIHSKNKFLAIRVGHDEAKDRVWETVPAWAANLRAPAS